MRNILTFGLLLVVAYWIAGLFFHFPMFGAFLFFPLALCALMFLFMDHGNKRAKKAHDH